VPETEEVRVALSRYTARDVAFFFVFVVLLAFSFGTNRRRRRSSRSRSPRLFNRASTETANWVNLTLARMRSADLDNLAMRMICQLITDGLAADPDRPKLIANLRLSPLASPTQLPIFSDFQIIPRETKTIFHVRMSYRPSAAVRISVTPNIDPAAVQNLLHLNLNLEFWLTLLVFDLRFYTNQETRAATLAIRDSFVLEMHSRPIHDEAGGSQQDYLEALSAWISKRVSLGLPGRKFPILPLKEGL
jgi:hypothetical protein